MARFRPYVDAVQWTGTNVIEVRQFVRTATGAINDAVIRDGVLYIEPSVPGAAFSLAVPVSSWVVIAEGLAGVLDNTEFLARYEPDL